MSYKALSHKRKSLDVYLRRHALRVNLSLFGIFEVVLYDINLFYKLNTNDNDFIQKIRKHDRLAFLRSPN